MILTTCKYFDLVGNRCSRVTGDKCNDLDCEFKYIEELKAENARLKSCLQEIKEIAEKEYTKNLVKKDCCECDASFWLIIDLITKAESEGEKMWTYRDRTFCANKNCPNKQCYRRLTDEIKEISKLYKVPVAYSTEFECIEKDNEDYLTEH